VSVQLVSKISNLCDPDPPTSQTDGQTDRRTDRQTDRRTTCNLNTALCTSASRGNELPQRWPRDAPCIWVPWKLSRVPEYAHGYFSEIFNGLLFRSIPWMWVQNLKFVVLPIPEITVGTQKSLGSPWKQNAPFSPKFLMGFCSDRPCECIGQICRP